jgi:mono/diheme cytochrome c family protein
MFTKMIVVSIAAIGALTVLHAQNAPTIKKVEPKATSAASGQQMFHEYCAACHGMDAKGKGPAAAALKKEPANLTTLSARNNGTFPEMHVYQFIQGNDEVAAHGSRDMPVWGTVFGSMHAHDNDMVQMRIANLTAYIKSLQK